MSKKNKYDKSASGKSQGDKADANKNAMDKPSPDPTPADKSIADKPTTEKAAGAKVYIDPFAATPESQKQRWVKYGSNVVLTIVIAFLLVGFLSWIAQRHSIRKDTTASGNYSLKPQTLKILDSNTQKFKIVGLYSKTRQAQEKVVADDDGPEARYQEIADLLQEYQQKSSGRISYEMIDPDNENARVEKLFNEVISKYSNDVKMYKDVLDNYSKTVDQVTKLANEDIEAIKKLPEFTDQKLQITYVEIYGTLSLFSKWMEQLKFGVKEQLELKVPDYKAATDAIRERVEPLVESCESIIKQFDTLEADPKTPKELTAYIKGSRPRILAIKKLADDLMARVNGLKSIKQLDELRQNRKNSIVVMGETDMKVLPFESVYKTELSRADAEGKTKPRFAGEQQVSTSLVRLSSKEKKKVAFIRAGGPPVTLMLPMVRYRGDYVLVAERLREFDIDILEKDLTGQWSQQAMQLLQQGMPIPMEPPDEELKDAVWIVVDKGADPRQMMMSPLGMRVADHLKSGGSALILGGVQSDDLKLALMDWGITMKPNALIVHDKIEGGGAKSEDPAMEWQRQQPVFILNKYGDHLITRPLQSLDSIFAPLIPVSFTDTPGVKAVSILPIPNTVKVWGETDFDKLRQGDEIDFNPKKVGDKEGDIPGPMTAGIAAEKAGARLVVIGSLEFPSNELQNIPDVVVRKNTGKNVPRFPANGELFVNSVHWLAKMDTLIAISPLALEVPRVAPMTDGVQRTWWIVLIGVMPLLVVASGALVWFRRRD